MWIKRKIWPVYILLALLTAGWIISCENKNEEDLFGEKDCDTTQVTFTGDVKPILDNICSACHYKPNLIATPRNFEGYDNFYIWVNNGRVQGAINHLDGFSPMPKGRPKLPDCNLDKINKWIREGALNN